MKTRITRITQVIKMFGAIAIVAAFAATAFPTNSFASPARIGGTVDYGKAVVTVISQSGSNLAGKPIAGATAELVNASGVTVAKYATNSNGQISFAVAGGSYKISVSAQGFENAGSYFDIKNGQTTNLTIRMQPVASASDPAPAPVSDPAGTPVPANDPAQTPVPSASGKVVIRVESAQATPFGGLQGVAVAGATLVVFDGAGTTVSKQITDSNGQAGIGLAEGIYKVSVLADGFQTATFEFTVKAGQATNLTVVLTPAK